MKRDVSRDMGDAAARTRQSLCLLQIEDSENDAELVRLELERNGFDLTWKRVHSKPALEGALHEGWDVVISDYTMPGFSGLSAHELLKRHGLDMPFIFVSGTLGEGRAVEAMRAGAADYFVKGDLTGLNASVRRALAEATTRRANQMAEQRAARERQRLTAAVEASNASVFDVDFATGSTGYSGPWQRVLGFEAGELPRTWGGLQAWLGERVHPEDRAASDELLAFLAVGPEPRRGQVTRAMSSAFRIQHRDGTWVDVAVFARPVHPATSPAGPPIDGSAPGQSAGVTGVLIELPATRPRRSSLTELSIPEDPLYVRAANALGLDLEHWARQTLDAAALGLDLDPGAPPMSDARAGASFDLSAVIDRWKTGASRSEAPDERTLARLVSNVTETVLAIRFAPGHLAAEAGSGHHRVVLLPIRGRRDIEVALSCDDATAEAYAAAFIGCSVEQLTRPMVDDALRELVNMVAGQIQSELHVDQRLGLPKFISPADLWQSGVSSEDAVVLSATVIGNLNLWVMERDHAGGGVRLLFRRPASRN